MQNEVGKVQSKGRFGDTMLVHMNPIEVKAISDQVPGGLTTNPDTGLPEAFLPLALGLLGGWGGGALATGLGAAGAGLGSFAGSMLQGDDFKDAALGGLTSFGLGSMMNAAGGAAGGGMNAANEKLAGEVFKDSTVPTLSGSGQFGIPTNSFIGEGSGVPAFTEMGFKNQGKFLGNIGLEQAAKNALTVNPIGTAAAGIGLLGGGGGALMSPGEMPVVEPRAKKDYGDMSEKFPSPAREYRKPGIDYQPGIDPEFSYFSPQNIGYAVGGQVGYGYDKGTNTYNFNRTSTPTLTPSIPSPEPTPISIAGQEVGVAPQVIPATDGGDGVVVTPTEVAAIDNPNSSPIGAKTTGAGILNGLTTLAGLPGIGMALGAAAGAADAYQAEARGGRVTGVTPSISGAAYGASPFGIGFDSPQQQLDSFIGKNMDDFNNTPMRGTGVSLPSLPAGGVTPSALDDSGAVGYGGGQDYGGGNTFSSDFAEGGQVQGPDPLIMGAVAAIMGSHPEPQQAIAAFVQVHGPEAFTQLRQQVIASASADQRGQEGLGGMIEGPGTGTSDSIPGQITQNGQPVEDIKVSNGEYILPEKAVEAFPEKKAGLDQFVANATGARPNNA